MTSKRSALAAGAFFFVASCEVQPADRPAVRLVELFDAGAVEGSTASGQLPPSTEWRFDGAGPSGSAEEKIFELDEDEAAPVAVHGWHALSGIDGLDVRDGRLVGRITGMPILHTVRPEGMEEDDLLHAVEIRLRVTSGKRLGVGFDDADELKLGRFRERMQDSGGLALNVDITPGDELQTLTLTSADSSFSPSFSIGGIRHLFLRVFDADEGSELELESVRLVSRREHLAQIPAGVSWQGCSEIYREVLVARSPETVHLTLDLPREPWLDMQLGTVEEGAVTFGVELRLGESDAPVTESLLRRTLTRSGRWEPTPLELAPWAGQRVTLSFTLTAEDDGAIGFWGAPVVRSRGARAAALAPSPARAALGSSSTGPPRGVILIIADTLRSDHLDAWGYERPTAPTLARLASEGARFADNISQGAWTKVSVSSILTSMYPSTHGIVESSDRLPASVTTLAECFNQAGYATFATSSVPFTGKLTNLHQGLEVLHERGSVDEDGSKTARTFVDRLLEWIELHQDGPFYARLHVFDPHSPFEPRRPYDTRWAEAGAKARHEKLVEQAREVMEDSSRKRRGLPWLSELQEAQIDPDDFTRTEIDWYDASIRAMDAEIARLVERLEELGLADDTLIAFISDHGEEFLEHGKHWHGDTVYGEMTNVPLFVHWPGVVPAVVVEETVQSIDLAATLIDLCSLPRPEEVQGQSLLPLLTGADGWEPRPAFSEIRIGPNQVLVPDEDFESFSIVSGGWRLIQHTVRPAGRAEFELYDHAHDPLNAVDLAAEKPELVSRLAEKLDAWREWAEGQRIEAEDMATMDPAELEQLRALGYVR